MCGAVLLAKSRGGGAFGVLAASGQHDPLIPRRARWRDSTSGVLDMERHPLQAVLTKAPAQKQAHVTWNQDYARPS